MCSDISATITTRNDRPFSPKQAAVPKNERRAGEQRPEDAREIELDRVERDRVRQIFLCTSDGISDWYAGPPNACAKPVTERQRQDVPDADVAEEHQRRQR